MKSTLSVLSALSAGLLCLAFVLISILDIGAEPLPPTTAPTSGSVTMPAGRLAEDSPIWKTASADIEVRASVTRYSVISLGLPKTGASWLKILPDMDAVPKAGQQAMFSACPGLDDPAKVTVEVRGWEPVLTLTRTGDRWVISFVREGGR